MSQISKDRPPCRTGTAENPGMSGGAGADLLGPNIGGRGPLVDAPIAEELSFHAFRP